jgi:acyl-coenzyme A thioesterase PaaI-like protein
LKPRPHALRSSAAGRLLLNLYPPYLMTGIVVREIARDWRRIVVRMGLHWYNRNFFGTHFGASLYAMTDPFYVLMLTHNIGRDHIVWDRAASIEFLRPGRGVVSAVFELTPERIAEVLEATAAGEKYQPTWPVEVRDDSEEVVARVMKTLYVRRKPGR